MLINLLTAAHQAHLANKIKPERPTYQIPQEVLKNQAMYKNMVNTSRLPGQSNIENQIGANSSNAINAAMQGAGSSSDILASIGNTQNNTNGALNNLALEGAQNQNQNIDKLANSNNQLAEYRDQAFDYNQNQPYELALMRKRALEGAAYGNVDSAARDMHQAGMSFLSFTGSKGK